jgi:hypothetical protein
MKAKGTSMFFRIKGERGSVKLKGRMSQESNFAFAIFRDQTISFSQSAF